MGTNDTYALSKAIELATANLTNTTSWVEPEKVSAFIEKVAECIRNTTLNPK